MVFAHARTHTRMHTHRMYTHTRTHIHTHAPPHTHTHGHTHGHTQTHASAHARAHSVGNNGNYFFLLCGRGVFILRRPVVRGISLFASFEGVDAESITTTLRRWHSAEPTAGIGMRTRDLSLYTQRALPSSARLFAFVAVLLLLLVSLSLLISLTVVVLEPTAFRSRWIRVPFAVWTSPADRE